MYNPMKPYRQHYNLQLLLCSGLLTLSSMNFAFDNQGYTQTLPMDQFERQFGTCDAKGKCGFEKWWLSLFNSLIFIGQAAGIVIGSMVSARYGRRMTCFTMSLWTLVCATISITAQHSKWQILVGRMLNYIYIGMEYSTIPIFQGELVPKEVRGVAVVSYQLSISLGAVLMSCVCRGTSEIDTSAAWRIPFGLMYVTPIIVASLIWFIPESPRWLISKGRVEEARTAMIRLRKNNADVLIDEEIQEIELSLEAEKDSGTYADLFRPANRRRTMIVAVANIFLQATGQTFWTQYGGIYVKSLHVMNTFNYLLSHTATTLAANIVGISTIDKFGRRANLMTGQFVQGTTLMVMGGLGTIDPPTETSAKGIIAMVVLAGCFYNLGAASVTPLISSELPSQRMRDKTVRFGGVVQVLTNFVTSFTVPYLLNKPYANLQGKVGFIYGSTSVMAIIFTYFNVPECKGLSLQEIDILFFENVPARKSAGWRPSHGTLQELSEMAHGTEQKAQVDHDEKAVAEEVSQPRTV